MQALKSKYCFLLNLKWTQKCAGRSPPASRQDSQWDVWKDDIVCWSFGASVSLHCAPMGPLSSCHFHPFQKKGNVNGFYLMLSLLSHSLIWNPFVNVIRVFGWANSLSLGKHCCSRHCWWCWWWWWIAWMGTHLHGAALRLTVLKFLSL